MDVEAGGWSGFVPLIMREGAANHDFSFMVGFDGFTTLFKKLFKKHFRSLPFRLLKTEYTECRFLRRDDRYRILCFQQPNPKDSVTCA